MYQTARFDYQDVPIIATFSKSNVTKYVTTCPERLRSNCSNLLTYIAYRAVLGTSNLTTCYIRGVSSESLNGCAIVKNSWKVTSTTICGSIYGRVRYFLSSEISIPNSRPSQTSIRGATSGLFSTVKHEATCSSV
jgi:hypothetical protein